jgi:hypothetical protein
VRITVAVASGSAVRRRSMRPFGNPFISTPEHLMIGPFNQQFASSGIRLENQESPGQDIQHRHAVVTRDGRGRHRHSQAALDLGMLG